MLPGHRPNDVVETFASRSTNEKNKPSVGVRPLMRNFTVRTALHRRRESTPRRVRRSSLTIGIDDSVGGPG